MIKEIRYRGFSTNPDDYAVPDGDLEGVSGLIPEDEALRPIQPPAPLFDLPQGKQLRHIHDTPAFRHYILHDPDTGDLAYTKDGGTIAPLGHLPGDISDIQSIGNTLLVLTPSGMHYFLFRDQRQGYLDLGDQIPFPSISFGLKSAGGEWTESREEGSAPDGHLASMLNRARAKIYDNGNQFIFPFFVRYALRLYDGSTTMPSPPVLMIPSCANRYKYNRNDTTIELVASELRYAFDDPAYGELWKKWGDIIKSVDIFISAPIYTWNQENPRKSGGFLAGAGVFDVPYSAYSVSLIKSGHLGSPYHEPIFHLGGEFPSKLFQQDTFRPWTTASSWTWNLIDWNAAFDGAYDQSYNKWIPLANEEAALKQICETGNFYLLTSIEPVSKRAKIEGWTAVVEDSEKYNLNTSIEWGWIDIKPGYLAALTTYESLRDDLRSHHKIIPQSAYVYNSRLNLAGLKEEILPNAHKWRLLPYTTPKKGSTLDIFFLLRADDGADITLHAGTYSSESIHQLLCFVYCPDPRAYKMVAFIDTGKNSFVFPTVDRIERDMVRHDFLSGAYTFIPEVYRGQDPKGLFTEVLREELENFQKAVSPTEKRLVALPSKVYTSEVNNPFSFPTRGVNSIGTGTILGISAATKALSQGQFGQFPLYALSTDGVWALEVAKDGTYIARQPISRDVCINPGSITQIDNAVLFTSERGIMLLSGSQCVCISDSLDPRRAHSLQSLPGSDALQSISGIPADQTRHIPLKDFLQGAQMVYDYPRQRLLVYHPKTRYAYVYSLKSKQWSAAPADIQQSLSSYPQSLAVTRSGKVVDYSKESPTKGQRGLLVTRPLKLGAPDTLKTVRSIIQRGYFRTGNVKTILYGSRDLFHWHLVASSYDHILRGFSGTPYKYFKVALICQLDPDETIFGCTVEFFPRLTNKPR